MGKLSAARAVLRDWNPKPKAVGELSRQLHRPLLNKVIDDVIDDVDDDVIDDVKAM